MHAVLISAYKDMPQLERLVQRLEASFFRIFVHLDTSSELGETEAGRLKDMGCTVIRTRAIQWGSYTNLLAVLDLISLAAETDVDYLHIISGQDYPIAKPDYFAAQCDGRIFIGCNDMSDVVQHKQIQYHARDFFYFLSGPRSTARLYRTLNRVSRAIQKRLRTRRKPVQPFGGAYTGVVWGSFPIEAARWLLTDEGAQAYLKALRTVCIPEEFFLQNAFMHSPFADRIIRFNMRYMDWARYQNGRPAFLDARDIEPALESGGFFARKVRSKRSAEFLDAIDQRVFAARETVGE